MLYIFYEAKLKITGDRKRLQDSEAAVRPGDEIMGRHQYAHSRGLSFREKH